MTNPLCIILITLNCLNTVLGICKDDLDDEDYHCWHLYKLWYIWLAMILVIIIAVSICMLSNLCLKRRINHPRRMSIDSISLDIDIDDWIRTFNSDFLPPYRSEGSLPPSYETIVMEEPQPPKYVDIYSPEQDIPLSPAESMTSMPISPPEYEEGEPI